MEKKRILMIDDGPVSTPDQAHLEQIGPYDVRVENDGKRRSSRARFPPASRAADVIMPGGWRRGWRHRSARTRSSRTRRSCFLTAVVSRETVSAKGEISGGTPSSPSRDGLDVVASIEKHLAH